MKAVNERQRNFRSHVGIVVVYVTLPVAVIVLVVITITSYCVPYNHVEVLHVCVNILKSKLCPSLFLLWPLFE